MVASSDNLIKEIEDRKKEYKTDSYSMSIGELTNLYRDGEIVINPEFQRFFRWDIFQKTSLIESILLGIPIPPIFVYQTEEGNWELVDGLQRVSTLLEFMGILRKGEMDELYEPSTLIATEQLQNLEDVTWDSLSQEVRLEIKRARITVEIIKKESDKDAKFEVFQRLNSNGSSLSPQEIRNSLLVMLNKDLYRWLKELSESPNFQSCISIPERLEQEQYDMELVLRYMVLLHFEATSKELNSINEFITQKIKIIAKNQLEDFSFQEEKERFEKTFRILKTIGKNIFRRYDIENDKFVGGFLESVYDPIAVGVAYNIDDYNTDEDKELLKEKIKNIWTEEVFLDNRRPGIPARSRLPRQIPFAKDYFKK